MRLGELLDLAIINMVHSDTLIMIRILSPEPKEESSTPIFENQGTFTMNQLGPLGIKQIPS